MTFADLYEEVNRLLPGESYCITVEAWRYRHDDHDTRAMTFSIWDGTRNHEGLSMEGALEALRTHLGVALPLGQLAATVTPRDVQRITRTGGA